MHQSVKRFVRELLEEISERPSDIRQGTKLYVRQEELVRFIKDFAEEYDEDQAAFLMPEWLTKRNVVRGEDEIIHIDQISEEVMAALKTLES